MESRLSSCRGCLLGLAVGDAMGYTVDDMDWETICENYGPNGLLGYDLQKDYAEVTSYTQIAAFVANGLLLGLAAKVLKMDEAQMGKKGLIKFNIAQVVGHIVCWGAVAPILDILMYNEPLEKLFSQGLMAGIGNSVTTAIIGSLLCIAYAATKTKAGSLTKE